MTLTLLERTALWCYSIRSRPSAKLLARALKIPHVTAKDLLRELAAMPAEAQSSNTRTPWRAARTGLSKLANSHPLGGRND